MHGVLEMMIILLSLLFLKKLIKVSLLAVPLIGKSNCSISLFNDPCIVFISLKVVGFIAVKFIFLTHVCGKVRCFVTSM